MISGSATSEPGPAFLGDPNNPSTPALIRRAGSVVGIVCLTDSSWADSANDTGASGFSQSRPRRVFPFGHSPYGTSTRRRPQLDFFDLILFYLFHTFPNDPVTPR